MFNHEFFDKDGEPLIPEHREDIGREMFHQLDDGIDQDRVFYFGNFEIDADYNTLVYGDVLNDFDLTMTPIEPHLVKRDRFVGSIQIEDVPYPNPFRFIEDCPTFLRYVKHRILQRNSLL